MKGLWVSFTREGYQTNMRNEAILIKVYKIKFGKWAPIARYGGYILFILSLIIA